MRISWIYKMVLIMFVFVSIQIDAQTVILREEVPENFEDEDYDYGPNRRTYKHPFMEYSLHSDGYSHTNSTLADILTLRSFGIASGYRTYTNLNKVMSLTFDTRFDYSQFSLANPSDSLVKLPVSNANLKRAHYFLLKYGISGGLQFNLKPNRGNQLGKYIKLGGMGNINLVKRFGAKYELPQGSIAKYEKVSLTNLEYVNRWNFTAEIGYGNTFLYLFGRYRISNVFDSSSSAFANELPRLTFGIQFYTSGA